MNMSVLGRSKNFAACAGFWRISGRSRIDGPSKCSVCPGALTATADEVIIFGGENGSRL